MSEPFIVSFVLALVSEIADKTQLVILGLALKYKSPLKVFFGALLAHAFMDGLAIILGLYLGFSLPSDPIKFVIGAIFVVLGFWSLYKIYFRKAKEESRKIKYKAPLAASFLVVLLSEFGDKTQIASGLLAAKYLVPIPIFLGIVLALAAAIGFNVFIGSKVAERLPRKTIKALSGILFILFGLFALLT